ncbi:hypothetical protein RclHR1_13700006 [Rhizophagus clarus]|uniref:Uncharacterized protein n=1 Tax=Rhizophagus clarus TaxID=94130 RepID=A0A2Z6QCP4_9GLOM|nr:hypothetical protein RclHR1_13700006 [Rhizophagus clarus]
MRTNSNRKPDAQTYANENLQQLNQQRKSITTHWEMTNINTGRKENLQKIKFMLEEEEVTPSKELLIYPLIELVKSWMSPANFSLASLITGSFFLLRFVECKFNPKDGFRS